MFLRCLNRWLTMFWVAMIPRATRRRGLRQPGPEMESAAVGGVEVIAAKRPVALRYPNGRVHETEIAAPPEFGPGYEFEAFGRRWRAIEAPRGARRRTVERNQGERIVCQCIGPAE